MPSIAILRLLCKNLWSLSKYIASTIGAHSRIMPRFVLQPTTSNDALTHSKTFIPISMPFSQIMSEQAIELCKKSL